MKSLFFQPISLFPLEVGLLLPSFMGEVMMRKVDLESIEQVIQEMTSLLRQYSKTEVMQLFGLLVNLQELLHKSVDAVQVLKVLERRLPEMLDIISDRIGTTSHTQKGEDFEKLKELNFLLNKQSLQVQSELIEELKTKVCTLKRKQTKK